MHYVAMMIMAIYGDMQIWRYMVKWLPYHNPLIHPPPPPHLHASTNIKPNRYQPTPRLHTSTK